MTWINVRHQLPLVAPGDHMSVLVSRQLNCSYKICRVIDVADYDTSSIPPVWRVWFVYINECGDEDVNCNIIDDVTHWMPLPKPPENI